MKPINQTWKEYLDEVNYTETNELLEHSALTEARDIELEKIKEVGNICLPYLKESYKAVLDRSFPKQIIKEETNRFPGSDKYPKYSFRMQCLVTGDCSKLLKMDEYPKYGILPKDTEDGKGYKEKQDISDKLLPVKQYYDSKVEEVYKRIREINELSIDVSKDHYSNIKVMWFTRYNEYLHSNEWHEKRFKVITKDQNQCLKCQSKENLQVHHMTYDNVGDECISELLTLCKPCHKEIHSMEYNDRQDIEQECMDYRQFIKD